MKQPVKSGTGVSKRPDMSGRGISSLWMQAKGGTCNLSNGVEERQDTSENWTKDSG